MQQNTALQRLFDTSTPKHGVYKLSDTLTVSRSMCGVGLNRVIKA